MNKNIAHYRRLLKKHLHCSIATRQKLLAQFDDSLSAFLEDYPAPAYDQLETAFGPPEAMAGILLEHVSDAEKINYQRRRTLVCVLSGILAAFFIAFTVYVYFLKEVTVVETYDELIPDNFTSAQEGN